MNNEDIGRFISSLRKEKLMSQKDLAQKLNVTDKAISKWETGKGAPDVSNLIPLATALEVSVTEILSGKRIVDNIKEENKVIVEAIECTEKTGKKNTAKAVISVILIFAIVLSTVYIGVFAFWSRRHLVLYDMDTVYLTETDDGYHYKIAVTARNWLINPFSMYSYNLKPYMGGEQIFSYSGGSTGNIVVTGLKETSFYLEGTIEASHNETVAKTYFLMLRFTPYDSEFDALSLYMQDHQDVEFVFQ